MFVYDGVAHLVSARTHAMFDEHITNLVTSPGGILNHTIGTLFVEREREYICRNGFMVVSETIQTKVMLFAVERGLFKLFNLLLDDALHPLLLPESMPQKKSSSTSSSSSVAVKKKENAHPLREVLEACNRWMPLDAYKKRYAVIDQMLQKTSHSISPLSQLVYLNGPCTKKVPFDIFPFCADICPLGILVHPSWVLHYFKMKHPTGKLSGKEVMNTQLMLPQFSPSNMSTLGSMIDFFVYIIDTHRWVELP
jgi:hypothetical protein